MGWRLKKAWRYIVAEWVIGILVVCGSAGLSPMPDISKQWLWLRFSQRSSLKTKVTASPSGDNLGSLAKHGVRSTDVTHARFALRRTQTEIFPEPCSPAF